MNVQRWKRYAPAAAALVLGAMYATAYRTQSMDFRLVGPSGEPLAGAYVLVEWELTGGLFEAVPAGMLRVTETSSGSDGRVHVPSLGPTWALWYFPARLDVKRNPRLRFFKEGYKPVGVYGPDDLRLKAKLPKTGLRDLRTLSMFESSPNASDYKESMESVSLDIQALIRKWDCQWVKAPAFTKAFGRALAQMPADSRGRYTRLEELQEASLQRGCGPFP